MYISRIICAVSILIVFLPLPLLCTEHPPLDIKMRSLGTDVGITIEEIEKLIPEKMISYSSAGIMYHDTMFTAVVMPISFEGGAHLDSISERADFSIVLIGGSGRSVLRFLKVGIEGSEVLYASGIMSGEGFISLKDLDGDSVPEVVAGLLIGAKRYASMFYWRIRDGKMVLLNDLLEARGISNIVGWIGLEQQKDGTIIITGALPVKGVSPTYFLPPSSDKLELVNEEELQE